MKTGKILIAVLILGAIAAGIVLWQYNKPHRDSATGEVTYSLAASELFEAFEADEQSAMKKYGNQLIEVTGTVSSSTTRDSSMILLESDHPLFGVKTMFQTPVINPPKPGETIVIRGFCSGINGDVELTRCTIINH